MSKTRVQIEHAAKADAIVAIVRARLAGPYVRSEEIAKAIGVSHVELVAAVERFKAAHGPKLVLIKSERSRNRRPRTLPPGVTVPPGQKWCAHCRQVLALDRFGARKASADGKQAYCIECRRDVCRESYERRTKATG